MSTPQERNARSEARLQNIMDMLRNNDDPSVIAQELAWHYTHLARECMSGLTPRPDLRDYWGKFGAAYEALSRKCKKIEVSGR